MAESTIVIRWKADNAAVISAADETQSAIGRTTEAARSAGGGFDVFAEIASGAMRRIGEAAINAVGSGLSKLGDFVKDGIGEAVQWQNAFAQTEAVITSTGGAAGKTAEDLASLAGEMSAANGMSLFSDDAILGAENVLATFTNIKGVNFDDTTSAILDVSQALGQDLQSTTIQVGKALNDPINGITALSRVGVSFTEQQKDQIKAMQEVGDVAGAQQIIIAELNKEFGGSAAAAVNTYAGQMTVLSEQFNDVKQGVGEALLPILTELGNAAVTHLVPAVQTMANSFKNWVDSVDWVGVQSLIGDVFTQISDAVSGVDWDALFADIGNAIAWVMDTANNLKTTFDTALSAIMKQVDIFWGIVGPIWNQLVDVFKKAWDQLAPLGDTFKSAFGDVSKQSETMAPIGEIIGNIAKAFLNVVGVLVQTLVPIIKWVFPLVVDYIKGVVTTVMDVYNAINYVFSGQLTKDIEKWWKDTVTKITTAIGTVIDKAKQMGKDIMNGVIDGVREMEQKLKDTFAAIVGGAVQWLKDLLGIHSPSKLMADAIGRPMMDGITVGLQSGMPSMTRALSDATGVAATTTTTTTQNYYLTANYSQMQSESSVATTLKMMQLQAGY